MISRPASAHFELPLDFLQSPPSTLPNSPNSHRGSFGVEYGAYSQPSLSELRSEEAGFDESSAAPPVIKTSKPPSGHSHLTAPRSPEKREGGGLRSFFSGLSTSRPSSRGSATSRASKDADAPGLGNISVERGISPVSSPEVRKSGKRDSWGKKTSRSQMGLMYMSSRERLRDNEDRRRSALGAGGDSNDVLIASAMSRTTSPRSDPFFAEMSITEGSPWQTQSLPSTPGLTLDGSMSPTPRTIPTRDSSLRKTGSNVRRSSDRNGRSSKRNSENGTIFEEEDYFSRGSNVSQRDGATVRNRRYSSKDVGADKYLDPSRAVTVKSSHYIDHYVTDTEAEMDGAPAPNIAQGKRRDREASSDRGSRRRSGRSTPELRVKRSSSRLKRLSGPLSPRLEDKPREFGPEHSNVTYERPQSADSIDDSVETYLRSPRLSQRIRHPQTGRVISFSEVGDPEGSAVFCCVGMGLTRYVTAFYDELALTLKLRLITPDRPGVGDSEAYADGTATPLGWPGEYPFSVTSVSSLRQVMDRI